MKDLEAVLLEVAAERVRQDAKWGGPVHDDSHDINGWRTLILKRIGMASRAASNEDYRRRMIQVAALAVAAVASFDRTR